MSAVLQDSYLRVKLFTGESKNLLGRSSELDELEINPIVGINATWDYGKWSSRIGFAKTTVDFASSQIQQLSDALGLAPALIWPQAPVIDRPVW